jgi:hypothetical protein
MFRKAMTGIAVAAASLALAAPAGATTTTPRTASFGQNGSVTMHYNGTHWFGFARISGFTPGHYFIDVTQDIVVNGKIASEASADVCNFTITKRGQAVDCNGSGIDLITKDWSLPTSAAVVSFDSQSTVFSAPFKPGGVSIQ